MLPLYLPQLTRHPAATAKNNKYKKHVSLIATMYFIFERSPHAPEQVFAKPELPTLYAILAWWCSSAQCTTKMTRKNKLKSANIAICITCLQHVAIDERVT